jgi:hypothetical protein
LVILKSIGRQKKGRIQYETQYSTKPIKNKLEINLL